MVEHRIDPLLCGDCILGRPIPTNKINKKLFLIINNEVINVIFKRVNRLCGGGVGQVPILIRVPGTSLIES